MKKVISLTLLLVLFVSLVSCDMIPHEHAYSEQWRSDDDFHWHACIGMLGCNSVSDKAQHDFEVDTDKDGNLVKKCTVCGFTSTEVSTAGKHEHEFADELSYNGNYHWYGCTVEGCYEKYKKAEHHFDNPDVTYEDGELVMSYSCADCEYVKVERQKADSTVDSALEWDAIFDSFKLTNFSIDVYLGGKENPAYTNQCIITENGVYYCIEGGRQFYVVKNADGSYDGYGYNLGTKTFFILPEDNCEEYFIGATRETVIQINFAENFDKFTYNAETGSYYSDQVIEAVYYSFSVLPSALVEDYLDKCP